jgi:hypothetical protein
VTEEEFNYDQDIKKNTARVSEVTRRLQCEQPLASEVESHCGKM